MTERHEGFGTGLKGQSPIGPRFWKKVIKGSEDACWNWKGTNLGKGNKGYGLIGYKGKLCLAHRVSYEIHNGPIPVVDGDRICVLHRCDNCQCVNPKHLFLGTQLENIQDKMDKGRNKITIKTKLSRTNCNEAQIRVIRRCCQLKLNKFSLSRMFNCGISLVRYIHERSGWSEIQCLGDRSRGLDYLQLPPQQSDT